MGAIDLNLYQMLCTYGFVLVVLFIVRKRKISREKEIVVAATRMTIQLFIAGVILQYLFKNAHPALTLLVLLGMEIFAYKTIIGRIKYKLSKSLKKIVIISLAIGTLISIFYFILIIVRVDPWYDPRYIIPISGMLMGNAMTGLAISLNMLIDNITSHREEIENSLMLGATPDVATKKYVDKVFDAALLPTINSMLGTGIVILPGMMSGQILSGMSPIIAIKYQIAITIAIMGATAISIIILLELGVKTFFNKEKQLV